MTKKTDIKLPPLPVAVPWHKGYDRESLQGYDPQGRGEPVYAAPQPTEPETNDAAVSAIQFALETDEGIPFLRCWNEGNFDAIRREWPEAPESVFIGADPMHPETRALLARYSSGQPVYSKALVKRLSAQMGLISDPVADTVAQEPHGVIVCDKHIPNAMETFVPQRFFREAEWPDADYSKVVVYAAPVAQEPVGYIHPDNQRRLEAGETVAFRREPYRHDGGGIPVFVGAAPVAAQAAPIQWPTMPPRKGQSPVLFDDGYAEGWAKCMSECQKAVAAQAQHDDEEDRYSLLEQEHLGDPIRKTGIYSDV